MTPPARVEIRRTLHAPIERVFAAFSDPALVSQWLRPAPDVQLQVLTLEFREGGQYRFAYRVPDGTRMFVGGRYLRIEPPHSIVFSWLIEPPDEHAGVESQVTVLLAPSDGATELVLRHERWDRADAEARHTAGWQGALDLLALQLAQSSDETEVSP